MLHSCYSSLHFSPRNHNKKVLCDSIESANGPTNGPRPTVCRPLPYEKAPPPSLLPFWKVRGDNAPPCLHSLASLPPFSAGVEHTQC